MRPRRRRFGPRLLLCTSLFVLVSLEVGLRSFYPVADPFAAQRRVELGAYVPYRHPPDLSLDIVPEPGLPGVEGTRHFRTNAQGYVGPALTSSVATRPRVFLVGGSTMECVALGVRSNPATLIHAELEASRVDATIVNTAHSGDATFDHLAVLTHRIAHQSPHVVAFLVGVNDLIASARGERYDHPSPDQTIELDALTLLRLSLTRTHLGRVLWAAVGRAKLRPWDEDSPTIETRYGQAAERCAELPESASPPTLDPDGFARNLRALVAITRSLGATPILITQPSSWRSPEATAWWWMRCLDGRRYPAAAMHEALARLNQRTRHVAAETDAVLLDLARDLPGGPTLMYDDVHFNDAGAQALSRALAGVIASLPMTQATVRQAP